LHSGCIGNARGEAGSGTPARPEQSQGASVRSRDRLLREQGHTFESIREALAVAGVHVSNSTVQREVARAGRLLPSAPALARRLLDESARSTSESAPERPARAQNSLAAADGRSGKEIAEAFAKGRITNPLFRAKEQR
jgi:hypothetical protein